MKQYNLIRDTYEAIAFLKATAKERAKWEAGSDSDDFKNVIAPTPPPPKKKS